MSLPRCFIMKEEEKKMLFPCVLCCISQEYSRSQLNCVELLFLLFSSLDVHNSIDGRVIFDGFFYLLFAFFPHSLCSFVLFNSQVAFFSLSLCLSLFFFLFVCIFLLTNKTHLQHGWKAEKIRNYDFDVRVHHTQEMLFHNENVFPDSVLFTCRNLL